MHKILSTWFLDRKTMWDTPYLLPAGTLTPGLRRTSGPRTVWALMVQLSGITTPSPTKHRTRAQYFNNIWYFCPPPFFQKWYFFPKVNFSFFLFSTSYPLYSRFLWTNHCIFPQPSTKSYFCPPPQGGPSGPTTDSSLMVQLSGITTPSPTRHRTRGQYLHNAWYFCPSPYFQKWYFFPYILSI